MFTQDIISKLIIVFLIRLKMYKKWNRVCSDKLEQKLSKALVQNWEQTLEPLISNDHPFIAEVAQIRLKESFASLSCQLTHLNHSHTCPPQLSVTPSRAESATLAHV